MGVRITINEAQLMREYEQRMDAIYLKYFVHPTNIPHYELTAAEQAEIAEYDAMARGLSAMHKGARLDRDEKYCNGLPRKAHR